MFFSGDPSARKRVALGGRSSKERDRQKLVEQTRLEREKRSYLRKQTFSAIKIQKCFRGSKDMHAARTKVREEFYQLYGRKCENLNRHSFGPDSTFLRHLLFFFDARNAGDLSILVEVSRFVRQCPQGEMVSLFSGGDYGGSRALVDYRVKKLALTCVQAVHKNRYVLRNQIAFSLDGSLDESCKHLTLLLEVVATLMDARHPWVCKTVGHLLENKAFPMFRDTILVGLERRKSLMDSRFVLALENALCCMTPHIGRPLCHCPAIEPQESFISQLLTIPFLWQLFPHLKEVFAMQGLSQYYIHQMTLCLRTEDNLLPKDLSDELPGYACLLGNLLETAGVALSKPEGTFEMAVDLAAVSTSLLEALPAIKLTTSETKDSSVLMEDDETSDNDSTNTFLSRDLEIQISNSIDSRFLLQLTNVLFRGLSQSGDTNSNRTAEEEVAAIGAVCSFLHAAFNTLPLERIMTVLAYRTELVPVLWNFMKRCHESENWASLSQVPEQLRGEAPGWLLPLAVFCPIYKHMLMIVDNEEFYEQEKPLSLKDIRCLIVILKQALWQLLWVIPMTAPNQSKLPAKVPPVNKSRLESLQQRVSVVASELLTQLHDWNSRRQFAPSSDFHADGVNEFFISQATFENTKAHDILRKAPFLVPFTSRVKIFASQLTAFRQRHGSQAVFTRNRFRIHRDRILEDAYNQMSTLSEDDLRGLIRVSFVNEFGVEEAGIDGGGIFKDFMENITRAAFDIQYGLFKETSDHLLYPNPGSGLIHSQHLQFFHFLGTLLAKAMYEGILVDIPFAAFFLSKLKQKYNYLNDLPSLDPELYRHLIFLKHYKGNLADLELYFVIVNNEYGEQTEEELLPGGKSLRVTNENVITFIHLVANHRLNFQIRQQSLHFLRGFQQLIQKEWIDMFNEHELQLLISGSLDCLDVDDLRSHTNYAGGYHSEHYVIEIFWEVLKGFSPENQKKFLKFVTGCSRGPLLGFKNLEPSFCIQRAAGSATDEALDRLPTSATCMNLLKLPPYRSKEQLETKLMYAITADAGFDLS
ncbi:hypothetical protein MLD38_035996 [Melastoma candidum]|uniref:Uncharacterized protein n=1 Tax=Melastoma candidum TaxID=119954 RepID=A0ACB9LK70_9MYRT|nr:hypothetical protein MLD38_035996 [Melastoma candidum]